MPDRTKQKQHLVARAYHLLTNQIASKCIIRMIYAPVGARMRLDDTLQLRPTTVLAMHVLVETRKWVIPSTRVDCVAIGSASFRTSARLASNMAQYKGYGKLQRNLTELSAEALHYRFVLGVVFHDNDPIGAFVEITHRASAYNAPIPIAP